jgi:DNA-binding NarL/FixJ family response regulator
MSIRVAIVEDDDRVRESLGLLIDGADGFISCGSYATAAAAISGISARPPDVVLMDINMPRCSGIECVRGLRAFCPDLNILMLTVADDGENVFRALEAGANGYLLKRTPPNDILKAIQDVHDGGSPMTGSIARQVLKSFEKPAPLSVAAEKLTSREKETLDLLAKGHSYKEISTTLQVKYNTVHTHVRNIYTKLQVRSRTQAVSKYLEPVN